MIGRKNAGFTIIELLLFLSITGLMFAALMGGVSTNINVQRYKDSVSSLSGLLQQQYSEVANTRNDRDDNWNCNASTVAQDPVNGQPRGTTECVLLGRYIRTVNDGTQLELGDVVGTEPADTAPFASDKAALVAYNPKISTFGQVTQPLEWGAVLHDTNNHAASFSILILRSPLSGLLRTFAQPSPMPTQLTDMITDDNATNTLTTCVIADGWSFTATQAVVVSPATAGPNAIEVKGDDNGC